MKFLFPSLLLFQSIVLLIEDHVQQIRTSSQPIFSLTLGMNCNTAHGKYEHAMKRNIKEQSILNGWMFGEAWNPADIQRPIARVMIDPICSFLFF